MSTSTQLATATPGPSSFHSSASHQRNTHAASLANPIDYWSRVASSLQWHTPPTFEFAHDGQVLKTTGKISIYENLVSRYVADPAMKHRPALIYDSALSLSPKGNGQRGIKKQFTFVELDQNVRAVALKLLQLGVKPGDVVLIYMPMVPEAVFSVLACARVGAIHSVVFGGFAAAELQKRIMDAKPKVIIYGSCGLEPNKIIPYKPAVDESIAMSSFKPPHLILLNRPELLIPLPLASNTHLFPTPLSFSEAELQNMPAPVVLPSEAPLYLLYTSGSTGTPKGVMRDVGGHAVAAKHTMNSVLGVKKGDVMFAASDIGWVVGHTFIIYGPLLQGCTTVLYEGKPIMPKTDGAGAFWRMIQEYKINALYTAPTALRAIRKEDPEGKLMKKYNISSLRDVFLAGERCDPDTATHFAKHLGVGFRDNFWQTETGTPITSACVMDGHLTQPKMGSCGPPIPGYDVRVLVPPKQHQLFSTPHDKHRANESDYAPPAADADDSPTHDWVQASPGEVGSLVIKLPLPPGCFPTLWNNHAGYLKSYFERFPGYYDLTDQGFVDADGYMTVLGRSDDVLNVAGHRLSSGGMEEILMSAHGHQVAECAVVGVHDPLKTEKPVGFVVVKDGAGGDALNVLEKELIKAVRHKLGAVACFDRVIFVKRLPKTRSGKILRRSLRSIANGEKYAVPATIEDPESLHEIAALLGNTSNLKTSKL
ncbi:hypothetical protein HDU98_009776 [Podochytrium sp. JEL0797]|nr:hypothetical protein HDU98_009776 [Podochytrium sp. JEL0797]